MRTKGRLEKAADRFANRHPRYCASLFAWLGIGATGICIDALDSTGNNWLSWMNWSLFAAAAGFMFAIAGYVALRARRSTGKDCPAEKTYRPAIRLSWFRYAIVLTVAVLFWRYLFGFAIRNIVQYDAETFRGYGQLFRLLFYTLWSLVFCAILPVPLCLRPRKSRG